MLDLMMSNELHLAPVDKSEARRSAFVVGSSTIFGSFIPLIPYLFVGRNILVRTEVSVILSGIELAAIGLTAGLAGFLIGHFIGALPL
jgi:VIT1/CCC1 family predicted Fe2+/Mn2+ transporter